MQTTFKTMRRRRLQTFSAKFVLTERCMPKRSLNDPIKSATTKNRMEPTMIPSSTAAISLSGLEFCDCSIIKIMSYPPL
jgi:hypothetical protein